MGRPGRRGYSTDERKHKMTIIQACRQHGIILEDALKAASLSFPTYKKWAESGEFDMENTNNVADLKSEIKRLKYMLVRRDDSIAVLKIRNKDLKETVDKQTAVIKDMKLSVIEFVKKI